jgi:hypothetical protein
MTSSSKRALVKLFNTVDSTVASIHPDSLPTFIKHKHRKKNNTNDDEVDVTTFINGLPPIPKGKTTKQSTLAPNSKELQPRIRDYNGQGLVRPSLYLPLNDVSFVPKLEMEFAEHVEGFFGKAKTVHLIDYFSTCTDTSCRTNVDFSSQFFTTDSPVSSI